MLMPFAAVAGLRSERPNVVAQPDFKPFGLEAATDNYLQLGSRLLKS
jgi:hypothetical protein